MKKLFALAISLLLASFFVKPARAVVCTPNVYNGLSAYLVNPAGTVSGDVDATGCDIAVYYDQDGEVDGAEVHGSKWYGVLVDGDDNSVNVDVLNSEIHDIGDDPFSGSQHGVAVYYRSFNGAGDASGTVEGNEVYDYQKNGITANGNVVVNVLDNTVTGFGMTPMIAQNGVQFGWKSSGEVTGNTISGHYWTGCSNQDAAKTGCTPWVSAGILLYDVEAKNVKTSRNMLRENQFNYLLLTSQSLGLLP